MWKGAPFRSQGSGTKACGIGIVDEIMKVQGFGVRVQGFGTKPSRTGIQDKV